MGPELVAIFAAVGAVSGVMAGMFGIGGGVILVPVLYFTFSRLGRPPELCMTMAVATSLAIIIVNGSSAAIGHARQGHMKFSEVLPMAAGGMVGAILVTLLVLKMSGETVRRAFGVFEILLAVRFAAMRPAPKQADEETGPTDAGDYSISPVGFAATGLVAGLVAGAFGVGGGIIAVPALVLIYKFPYTKSVGISSGMVAGSALAGASAYIVQGWGIAGLPETSAGYVDYLAAAIIAPLGLIGAAVGTRLTTFLDELILKRLFAVALLVIGLRMVF